MTLSAALQILLFTILVPAIVAGITVLIVRQINKDFAAPIALIAGFMSGFFTVGGLGSYAFPPVTIQQWLPHIALASLALGIIEQNFLKNTIARWILRLALLELLLWRLLQPFINHPFPSRSWSTGQTVTNLILSTVIIIIFWAALDYLVKQQKEDARSNAVLPSALVIIGASSSIAVLISHSLVMSQFSGMLTASLGAIAVLSWLFKSRLPAAVTPILAMLYVLPWLSLYTTLPVATVALLALAPWMLIFTFKQKPLLQQLAFRIGLTIIPVIAAMIFAVLGA